MESTKSLFSQGGSRKTIGDSPSSLRHKDTETTTRMSKANSPAKTIFECKNLHSLDIMRKMAGKKHRNHLYHLGFQKQRNSQELLSDLPIFNEPDIVQKNKEPINDSLWSNVADFILHAKQGEICNYMNDKVQGQNLPFVYHKVNTALRMKSSIRKSRRIGFNVDGAMTFCSQRSCNKSPKKLTYKAETWKGKTEQLNHLLGVGGLHNSKSPVKRKRRNQLNSYKRLYKNTSGSIGAKISISSPMQKFQQNLQSTLTFRSKNSNLELSRVETEKSSEEEREISKTPLIKPETTKKKLKKVRSHKTIQKPSTTRTKGYLRDTVCTNLQKYKFNSPPPSTNIPISKATLISPTNKKYLLSSPKFTNEKQGIRRDQKQFLQKSGMSRSKVGNILRKIRYVSENVSPFARPV